MWVISIAESDISLNLKILFLINWYYTYFIVSSLLLILFLMQLINISTNENSGEYGTVWSIIIFYSNKYSWTSLTKWYLAPSQVKISFQKWSSYFFLSAGINVFRNARKANLFVFELLIVIHSTSLFDTATITEYLLRGRKWVIYFNFPFLDHNILENITAHSKFINLHKSISFIYCYFESIYVAYSF